ncbi:MAG TPA: sulfur carrier protein ThiS [Dehalococcoidia bacterium]|nr:sulfur carrier protein ThiS [Dehalococcoidia bacterium]
MIQPAIGLTLNGKQRELPAESTIASMLEAIGIDRRAVAVAHNGDVVPRDRYDNFILHEGDRVEVVRMVGGG